MSKARNKDTGTFTSHAIGVPAQPNIEHLDLGQTTKPGAANFQRGALNQAQGRARQNMPPETQGPNVPQFGPMTPPHPHD